MVRGIVDNFKCFFFVCMFAVSLFLVSLCPSIYSAAFERIFTSRCLCAIIRQCTITLSLFRCPLSVFFLLNCNCSHSSALQVNIYLQRRSNGFPAINRTLLLSYTRRVAIHTKDNQVTRSEVVFFCRIQQRNVLKSHFAACEKA